MSLINWGRELGALKDTSQIMEVAQKLLLVGISGAKIDDDVGVEDDEDEDEDEDEDDNGPWQGRGRRRGAEAAARTIGRPRHTKSIVFCLSPWIHDQAWEEDHPSQGL